MISFRFEVLGDPAGLRVLDLGCGSGRHVGPLAARGARVVALDLAPSSVEGAAATVAADGRRLPFRDGAFDLVIASEVLEHLREPAAIVAESRRVLRPQGRLVVSVPRFGPEAINWLLSLEYHSAVGGHVHIFTRRRLARLLAEGGFFVRAAHHSHALHSPFWWLRSLLGIEAQHWLVARFEGALVAELMGQAPRLTRLERLANPLVGKSLVMYAERP